MNPLEPLSEAEVRAASAAAKKHGASLGFSLIHFNTVTLHEPAKRELLAYAAGGALPARAALCVVQVPPSFDVHEVAVALAAANGAVTGTVATWRTLKDLDGQPLATPDGELEGPKFVAFPKLTALRATFPLL